MESNMLSITIFDVEESGNKRVLGKLEIEDNREERENLRSHGESCVPSKPGTYLGVKVPIDNERSALSFIRIG